MYYTMINSKLYKVREYLIVFNGERRENAAKRKKNLEGLYNDFVAAWRRVCEDKGKPRKVKYQTADDLCDFLGIDKNDKHLGKYLHKTIGDFINAGYEVVPRIWTETGRGTRWMTKPEEWAILEPGRSYLSCRRSVGR